MSDLHIDEIVSYWFGSATVSWCPPEVVRKWWHKDATVDEEIRRRFAAIHREALAGGCAGWLDSPRGTLAYVVLLDQLSRNMYRETAQMYAADALALDAALRAIEDGVDRALGGHPRTFFYMPLMHAEDLGMQDRCVELFRAFAAENQGDVRQKLEENVAFALRHREIVARFGRFPHRNVILGRASTPEEEAFLLEPGSSF